MIISLYIVIVAENSFHPAIHKCCRGWGLQIVGWRSPLQWCGQMKTWQPVSFMLWPDHWTTCTMETVGTFCTFPVRRHCNADNELIRRMEPTSWGNYGSSVALLPSYRRQSNCPFLHYTGHSMDLVSTSLSMSGTIVVRKIVKRKLFVRCF